MFSLLNGLYDNYLAPSQLNLLVVGAPESGKTTLLERLKVTDIPSRPRNGTGGKHTVQQRINANELPPALRAALHETGVADGRQRHRSLSKTSLASGNSSGAAGNAAPIVSAPQTPAPSSSSNKDMPLNLRTNAGSALVVTEKKRFSICPAPRRYARSADDQDEEIVDEETERFLLGGNGQSKNGGSIFRDDSFSNMSDPPQRVRCHSKEFDVDDLDLATEGMESMELTTMMIPSRNESSREMSMMSIGLDDDHPISTVTNKALQPTPELPLEPIPKESDIGPPLLQSSPDEYNLKSQKKMLPLRMIRPTIGTNLAKLDMYGAKCHIFDVGGKLQDLWERYYDDCDAVIFCWKLGEDPEKPPKEPDSDDDSDDEEEDINETIYKRQQELLDKVRKSIPDDVPFLILGHVFGNASPQIVDSMYNTDLLLPRYHNPMTGFCCSSAKTGAGVQSAMEWLIPLAMRQQKERIATKRELDMMQEEQGKSL